MENRRSSGVLRNNSSGFTLLEVIIAISIMVIAFASILSVESSSLDASARAKQMSVVGMLAKNQMVNTEFEIQGKSFDEIKKEDSGQYGEPFRDYKWTRTIKELDFPQLDISSSDTNSGNAADQNTDMLSLITKLVTQFLSQSIRQVTVTIHWQKGSKDQTFSLSTYWVDLNHDFQMSQ